MERQNAQLEMFPKETLEEKIARLEGVIQSLQHQVTSLQWQLNNKNYTPYYPSYPMPSWPQPYITYYTTTDCNLGGWNIEK